MAKSPYALWGSWEVLQGGIWNKCPKKREEHIFVWVLEPYLKHIFQSGGSAFVSFHVTMSTWEAPSLLAPSHSKEALLGNLIFLTTDAGVRSRCLRHVFSVCTVPVLGWKGSQKRVGGCVRAFPLACLPLYTYLFSPTNLAGSSKGYSSGACWGLASYLDPFSGKYSWVS